jgi:hypothetical protein
MTDLTQRLCDGDDHHEKSIELYKFIAKVDFDQCNDSFCFKSGGDGDNGELLMYMLAWWLEW